MPRLLQKITHTLRLFMTLIPAAAALTPVSLVGQVSFSEILTRAAAAPAPDARVRYGSDPAQFGNLWLPQQSAPMRAGGTGQTDARPPIVMLIHGGCWLNTYGVDHVSPVAAALRDAGMAVWAPEYRRIGDPGGGNPGTFEDVKASWTMLASVASDHGLDLGRVVLMGHSAGAHLALWLAQEPGITVQGVVSLAGITDLESYRAPSGCGASVDRLMGGSPEEVPEAFARYAPIDRIRPDATVPVILVLADGDAIVPQAQAQGYAAKDPSAQIVGVPGGHFDLIAPWAPAWPTILSQLQTLVRSP